MTYIRPKTEADAPKTLRESLERAAAFLKSDQQAGSCLYRAKGANGKECFCIIGSYLTDGQLDLLEANTALANGVNIASEVFIADIGKDVMREMTAMTRSQAMALQWLFDTSPLTRKRLGVQIKAVLAGKTDTIGDEIFKL